MAVFSFGSFAEANAFAKRFIREQKILVILKRNGEEFVVETKPTLTLASNVIPSRAPITPIVETDVANRKSEIHESKPSSQETRSKLETNDTGNPYREKIAGGSGNSFVEALRLAYTSQGLTPPVPIDQRQKVPNGSGMKQVLLSHKSSIRPKASQAAGVPSISPASTKNTSRNKSKYSVAKSTRKTGLTSAAIDRRVKIEAAREKLQAERLKREIAKIRTPDELPTVVRPPTVVTKYERPQSSKPAKPRQKLGVICDRCGGDGGVRGGCDKCDGTGWM